MASYGTFLYGDKVYGSDPGDYSVFSTDGITISIELWRADINNKKLEDISQYLTSLDINLDMTRDTFLSASFGLQNVCVVTPYVDYLAPYINVYYEDGRKVERQQMGLYTTVVPPATFDVETCKGTVEGADLCTVLADDHFSKAWNIAAGTNVVTAVRAIVESAGISRHQIPSTSKTLTRKKTFRTGVSKLEACNSLLHSIGFHGLSTNLRGYISCPGKTYRIASKDPWRTLTGYDIVEPIEVTPNNDRIANVVIVTNNNGNDGIKRARATNSDPSSPTSTVSLGRRIVKTEEMSGEVSQEDLQARADHLLAQGRSYYQTAEVKILPDYECLTPYQTVDLDLTGEAEPLTGRWWIKQATMSFDSDNGVGPSILSLNRLTRMGLAVEI